MHFRKQKTYLLHVYPGCNFRCRFCMADEFIHASPRPHFASLKKEIEGVKKDGYVNVDIGGSEPTLYRRLFDLVKLIQNRGMNPMLCTNGTRFADLSYVQSLQKLRPLGFEVSIHSHRADTFDLTTGVQGSFQEVLSGIRNLRKHFRAYPYDDPRNFIAANIVITRYNHTHLLEIARFLRGEGVIILKFSQLYVSGNVYHHPDLLIETKRIAPYLEKALAYAKAKHMHYSIDRLPICLSVRHASHFVSCREYPFFSVKLTICEDCSYKNKCCGITKTQFMAEYKNKLIHYFHKFPRGFFTKADEKFLNRIKYAKT